MPAVLSGGAAAPLEAGEPRSYAITREIGMPHLEESLRYAATREERCLVPRQLVAGFELLRKPALAGCTLEEEKRERDTVFYRLACTAGSETSGGAEWVAGERRLAGVLRVRLGGKNMTMWERITAIDRGPCTRAGD